jgi:hypothetical protein
MLLSAIPDLLRVPGALSIFRHLGYPPYLLPFLGTAKTLGVVAILVPGRPRFKEWAFAGGVRSDRRTVFTSLRRRPASRLDAGRHRAGPGDGFVYRVSSAIERQCDAWCA